MPGFHPSVAVLPLPLRKFRKFRKRRKNYVAYVKNSVVPLPFQLPLRRNRRSVATVAVAVRTELMETSFR